MATILIGTEKLFLLNWLLLYTHLLKIQRTIQHPAIFLFYAHPRLTKSFALAWTLHGLYPIIISWLSKFALFFLSIHYMHYTLKSTPPPPLFVYISKCNNRLFSFANGVRSRVFFFNPLHTLRAYMCVCWMCGMGKSIIGALHHSIRALRRRRQLSSIKRHRHTWEGESADKRSVAKVATWISFLFFPC